MPIAAWGFAPALAAGNTVVLKARRDHSADRACGSPSWRSRPGSRRACFQVLPGRGAVVGEPVRHARGACARSSSPASTRIGKQIMAGCRGAGEAGDAGARRQEREHRVRRRRPRQGPPRPRRPRPSTNAGQGLLRAVPGSWSSSRCSTTSWPSWRTAVLAVKVGDPKRRGHRDGAADHRRATGPRSPATCPTTHRSPSAASAPDGAGFWFPPTVLAPVAQRHPRPSPRRSSGPCSPSCPSATRPTRSASRNAHRVRPVRFDLDPRHRPGPAGPRGASRRATCPSTRTPPCATRPRSADFKQSGLGRELGPDALDAFTETKKRLHLHRGLIDSVFPVFVSLHPTTFTSTFNPTEE